MNDLKKEIEQRYRNLDYDKVAKDFFKRVKGKAPNLKPEEIVATKEFHID